MSEPSSRHEPYSFVLRTKDDGGEVLISSILLECFLALVFNEISTIDVPLMRLSLWFCLGAVIAGLLGLMSWARELFEFDYFFRCGLCWSIEYKQFSIVVTSSCKFFFRGCAKKGL